MASFIVACKALVELLKLSSFILVEIFKAKKKAREASEKWELDQEKFWEMVDISTDKMLDDAENDSRQARSVENTIDSEYEP